MGRGRAPSITRSLFEADRNLRHASSYKWPQWLACETLPNRHVSKDKHYCSSSGMHLFKELALCGRKPCISAEVEVGIVSADRYLTFDFTLSAVYVCSTYHLMFCWSPCG
ncbi:hypothetical protein NPIL_597481 [Nephila pilipes]|uniref:Uncharacterized protein n=1 Tax=Nephila pilipes TaxID=299642 RepID=A0A8X6Q867_NEPPI|nr:hypothetical protein NPIL_597481 [Nephila pilipes]